MLEIEGILNTLKDVYVGNAWHGPSVKEILSKIPEEKLNSKISNGHTILELILHMEAWRNFVIQKLNGQNQYEVADESNFPGGTSLREAIEKLDKSQEDLLSAISNFDPQKLHREVPGRNFSYFKLLHGIVHHDLYHLGQIVMISKQF